MAELANCTRCDAIFVKTIRNVCQSCYQKEEEAYQIVYRFLTKRENRESTIKETVKATGVEEAMIIRFMKDKRLRPSEFPKLAYPCERCGVDIVRGRFCANCTDELKRDLERHEDRKNSEAEQQAPETIYYTFNRDKK
ncbi:TIGR03826 family flagellar region protein [Lentibacillus salicampi]|uniref:Flagellar protein n=1 Tax=Lentibacillus salicampi TaxID=175306 RepID=A0A4Y9ABL0_9BACI|nr:TIGR03826 family flagellar region protein [Lentibacillus salicampi]TFJ93299.1 hypothetical protein E4U82_07370 [Lentibacillus salicampi]